MHKQDYWEYPPHMLRRTYITAMRQGTHFACGICSESIIKIGDLTIDHIIPKSKGGSHNYENLQPAHKWCNGIKSNTEPEIVFEVYRPTERPVSLQNNSALVILNPKA